MPVVGEHDVEGAGDGLETEEAVGIKLVFEAVGLVGSGWRGGLVVQQGKAFGAGDDIHHVDLLAMALAALACLEVGVAAPVLAVLHADGQRGAGDGCASAGNGEEVGLLEPAEEGLPLGRVAVVLDVEVDNVDSGGGEGLGEAVLPFTFLEPLLGNFLQLFRILVGVGLRLHQRGEEEQEGEG